MGKAASLEHWWPVLLQAGRRGALHLWEFRATLVSIAAGAALIGLRPEARDLFLEGVGWLGALKLAVLTLIVWAMQVYLSALAAVERVSQASDPSPPLVGRMTPIIA